MQNFVHPQYQPKVAKRDEPVDAEKPKAPANMAAAEKAFTQLACELLVLPIESLVLFLKPQEGSGWLTLEGEQKSKS